VSALNFPPVLVLFFRRTSQANVIDSVGYASLGGLLIACFAIDWRTVEGANPAVIGTFLMQ
jgi:hypothetical protein